MDYQNSVALFLKAILFFSKTPRNKHRNHPD